MKRQDLERQLADLLQDFQVSVSISQDSTSNPLTTKWSMHAYRQGEQPRDYVSLQVTATSWQNLYGQVEDLARQLKDIEEYE